MSTMTATAEPAATDPRAGRADGPPERRSRRDYLAAGLDVLADGGESALTINELCRRLGVTKGSFYHHFASGSVFRRSLLEEWAVTRTAELAAQIGAEPNPVRRIGLLKAAAIDLDHEAEAAIRSWAGRDPAAARAQAEVDAVREAALVLAFTDLGVEPAHAAVLGRLGVAILVGSQQLEERVDRARLAALFDEYERWVLDALPPHP